VSKKIPDCLGKSISHLLKAVTWPDGLIITVRGERKQVKLASTSHAVNQNEICYTIERCGEKHVLVIADDQKETCYHATNEAQWAAFVEWLKARKGQPDPLIVFERGT
jgi:hypothetical protein